jgi:hypothetical protein
MPEVIKESLLCRVADSERRRPFCVDPEKEAAMPRDKEGHGIILDDKGQEQPTDKDRAQTAQKTEPGRMPSQPEKQEKPDPKT